MERNMFEVNLSHLKDIGAVGKEDIASLYILGHELILAFLESLQLSLVVALNPTSLVKTNGNPAALGIILVFETILDDLELQLSNRPDELAIVELVDKELRHALTHQLIDTLGQLLGLHGIIVLDVLEHLGREARQSLEMQRLTLGNGIANLEIARVGQTDDVAGIGLLNGTLTLRHELGW